MAAASSSGSRSDQLVDPSPDIFKLFHRLNQRYFWGELNGVQLKWSKRPVMAVCAGLCEYQTKSGQCTIYLSTFLLKQRSRRDLVESLLHEMIHAYLFLNKIEESDSHGPVFCSHMQRINAAAGLKINIFHTFHKEVQMYEKRWLKCDGPCKNQEPYFGFFVPYKPRKPSWWGLHKNSCGGRFKLVQKPHINELFGEPLP